MCKYIYIYTHIFGLCVCTYTYTDTYYRVKSLWLSTGRLHNAFRSHNSDEPGQVRVRVILIIDVIPTATVQEAFRDHKYTQCDYPEPRD